MSKQISVIGCGWLGLPLAKQLVSDGYLVKGSTTTKSKIETLKKNHIGGYFVRILNECIEGDITLCLEHSKILIINVPPGLRTDSNSNYLKRIQNLISYIEASTIKYVIFISSTSVYNDEENFPIITEENKLNPIKESGRQLVEVESLLRANNKFSSTILRFSGLYGVDRHPATFLSGKNNINNPEAPVNLIHLDDCISIIMLIIKHNLWNEVFNASTIPHPTKKDYYTRICKALEIPVPNFDFSSISKGKIIDASKLVQQLSYEFKHKL